MDKEQWMLFTPTLSGDFHILHLLHVQKGLFLTIKEYAVFLQIVIKRAPIFARADEI